MLRTMGLLTGIVTMGASQRVNVGPTVTELGLCNKMIAGNKVGIFTNKEVKQFPKLNFKLNQ